MMKKYAWMMVICLVMMTAQTVDAKRLGGGRSIGQQSGNVTQRHAAPAQGTAPNAARPNTPQPSATPPVPPPKRPWGGMLGGLAAGLGLAWLASSMGLGVGSFGMVVLLALLVMVAIVWFKRRSSGPLGQLGQLGQLGAYRHHTAPPFALAGAGAANGINQPAGYQVDKVGNDASARPWEQHTASFDATASQTSGPATWSIPPGFDTEGFLKSAKANFVLLQAAWDRSDTTALRSMVTDAMLMEIQAQMVDRNAQPGGGINQTDVGMLDAHLLGIEDCGDHHLASVEFSGVIRESPVQDPGPFREVWNMTRPKDNATGWLVAGVQTLQ